MVIVMLYEARTLGISIIDETLIPRVSGCAAVHNTIWLDFVEASIWRQRRFINVRHAHVNNILVKIIKMCSTEVGHINSSNAYDKRLILILMWKYLRHLHRRCFNLSKGVYLRSFTATEELPLFPMLTWKLQVYNIDLWSCTQVKAVFAGSIIFNCVSFVKQHGHPHTTLYPI